MLMGGVLGLGVKRGQRGGTQCSARGEEEVCAGEVTEPRNVESRGGGGRHALEFTWDAPECGDVAEYEWRLFGESPHALFELHSGTGSTRQATLRYPPAKGGKGG